MYLIEILLPLYDNQKRPFARADFDQVRNELAQRHGGVTAFRRSPAEGVWKTEGEVNIDEVVIFEVMVDHLDRQHWQKYRQELERRFRQEQLVMRAVQFEQL